MLIATRDFVYHYHVTANSIEAHCRLRLYRVMTGGAVVVATELPDNPGMSITDAAEELATAVRRDYNLDPTKLVWIEHYTEIAEGWPERMPDSYDWVSCT